MSKKPHNCKPDAERLVTEKPIALRLRKTELAEAKKTASRLGCSRSALARSAFLAGLPIVVAKAESQS